MMLYIDALMSICGIQHRNNTLKYLCTGSQPALGKALLAIIDKQSDPSPEDGAKRKSRRSEAHTEKSAVKGVEYKVSSLVCNLIICLHMTAFRFILLFLFYVFYIVHIH